MSHLRILLLAVALSSIQALVPPSVEARCGPGSTDVWPPASSPLTPRSQIIVRGFAGRAAAMERIGSQHPMLVSGRRHRVPLVVVAIQRGDRRLTQVVLAPETDLRVGDTYELRIGRRTPLDIEGHRARWTVEVASSDPIRWNAAPIVENPTLRPLGCGPERTIPIVVDIATSQPSRFRVRVWRDGSNESDGQKFDLFPWARSRITLGHGMCNGLFSPPRGTLVHFRISAMDGRGHEIPMPGPTLSAVFP